MLTILVIQSQKRTRNDVENCKEQQQRSPTWEGIQLSRIKTKTLQLENKMSSGRAVMNTMGKGEDEIIPCLQHGKLKHLLSFQEGT